MHVIESSSCQKTIKPMFISTKMTPSAQTTTLEIIKSSHCTILDLAKIIDLLTEGLKFAPLKRANILAKSIILAKSEKHMKRTSI